MKEILSKVIEDAKEACLEKVSLDTDKKFVKDGEALRKSLTDPKQQDALEDLIDLNCAVNRGYFDAGFKAGSPGKKCHLPQGIRILQILP